MSSTGENSKSELEQIAAQVLETEAKELMRASRFIGPPLIRTAEIILNHAGKIVVSGIGKSGHIGEKIVATLCSTGIQAVFVHAAEALHGDLGVYSPGDPTLLISKSGSTEELLRLIPILREFQSPLIGLLGKMNSPLAKRVDLVLDASVEREADPLGIVPTSSTTLTMAIGDALAAVLMAYRKFEKKDFARFHPGGDLGRRLSLTVKDIMHPLSDVAVARRDQNIREVVIAMTDFPQGAALVLDEHRHLEGIITDGDLRRCLLQNGDIDKRRAEEVMTPHPVTLTSDSTLEEAISLMENRESQISVLPVLDQQGDTCVGLLRLHDINQTRLFA